MKDILPCPFCGEAPITFGSGEGQRGLMIECMTEHCVNPHVSYYHHDAAKAVWNRREQPVSDHADCDAAIERLRLRSSAPPTDPAGKEREPT